MQVAAVTARPLRGNRPIATALAVTALTALGGHIASAAPVPIVDDTGAIAAPSSTQISFAHNPTGLRADTANEHESRADVSIVKMYPAEYVLTYVDPADHADATEMIRSSNDAIADRLHAEYPQAISSTAAEFGLTDTHVPGYWGVGTTSTHDMVTYRETKKRTDPGSPVLAAMATAYDTAVDGYPQDYGTALIAGVIGTKRGWSDDRSFHASDSFGPDFSVAASTYGSAGTLSEHVLGAFTERVPPGPETGPSLQDCPPLCRLAGDPLLGPPAQDLLDGLPPVVTDPICG
ncbi:MULTISPECIES: hypothetical protein [Rhodococcus]|uniref:Uncharacterized protein n=1 Tax=Rhodococcus pyridinivorans SB3094 TaxID=1435356 RepID=V9XDL8_9NOCA|nr:MULTISPECIES: hypothetical protein [Rhodococcus]AHD20090.1 hypothetical protein Y013_05135 [Rhodococcus pyridinivorans SB3094]MCT7292187.1 hypothetical protein [Rhodococcus sp. PAE-6]USI88562.1 hypothetical protein LLA01_13090 [Rhodococcus pyridinivorans]